MKTKRKAIAPPAENPVCFRCGQSPGRMDEYVGPAAEEGMDVDAYVREEEGTYNPKTNTFACTPCYVAIGAPTAPGEGWKAPPRRPG